MQVQIDIGFEQLVKIAKKLPKRQWQLLKQEVEQETEKSETISELEALLLSAPTFTESQLNEIDRTRKAINQWRKK